MDCNKEEASRAKYIAQQKMQLKDFAGARKLAVKAQKLYPDLENVTQMITVCDVHCFAEQKLYSNEMDWYRILQVEPAADEATIKKQYRKFALQLHPDKNGFPGAEAAFKLIGEAQRVLLDHQKRYLHDMKRKVPTSRPTVPPRPSQKAKKGVSAGPQMNTRGGNTYFNPQYHQSRDSWSATAQQGFNGVDPTFWTVCIYCFVRFQYYRSMLNKTVPCQNCNKTFKASELKEAPAPAPATKQSQEAFPKKNDFSQGTFKADSECKADVSAKKPETDNQKAGFQSNTGCEKQNGKRKRKGKSESSESSVTVDSSESEEDVEVDCFNVRNSFVSSAENRRTSSRKKQQVSYKENLSDDDDGLPVPSKRHKNAGSPVSGIAVEEDQEEAKSKQHSHLQKNSSKKSNGSGDERQNVEVGEDNSETYFKAHDSSKKGSTSKAASPPETYVCPDPEFSDFDIQEESFAAGQIWALFDPLDAMPRFYGRITEVISSEFEVHFMWLEPDPDEEDKQNWVENDLPISCGKYKLGKFETTNGIEMFSHLVSWEKGARRNSFKVHPRKGETWALFKNWDIMWYIDADAHQSFEYEFVEIVSDYVEGEGVRVAHLGKLKGFVSLFSRVLKNGVETYQVPVAEFLRFSHRVPSFQMTGDERDGVPKGSYELDPACLPKKVEEISLPENLDVLFGSTQLTSKIPRSSPRLRSTKKSDGSASTVDDFGAEGSNLRHGSNRDSVLIDVEQSPSKPKSKDLTPKKRETRSSTLQDKKFKGLGSSTSANADAPLIRDPQFHDFAAPKSEENFRRGQIWAVYCDEDGLPKNYCQIKKVDSHPKFKMHVICLSGSSPPNIIVWDDTKMLVSCGTFKVRKAEGREYTSTGSFSHQVQAVLKRNEHHIVPKKGEIWALYKNWTPKFTIADLKNAQYEIVEVLGENGQEVDVLVLKLVKDSVPVFKSEIENGFAVTRKISRTELYRFSHQIPAFKLTKEHDSSMIGFWELDTRAMPFHFFRTS